MAAPSDPMDMRPTIPEVREIVREELDRFCARIEAAQRRPKESPAFDAHECFDVERVMVEQGLSVLKVTGDGGMPVLIIGRGV